MRPLSLIAIADDDDEDGEDRVAVDRDADEVVHEDEDVEDVAALLIGSSVGRARGALDGGIAEVASLVVSLGSSSEGTPMAPLTPRSVGSRVNAKLRDALAFIFLSAFFDGFFCASSRFTFMTFDDVFGFVSMSSS